MDESTGQESFWNKFFCHWKTIIEQAGSAWNFLQPSIQVCRGAYFPYFKINAPSFCYFIFFEECRNPQIRINKMVNEHIVDYHPNLSEFTSSIHSLFLWTPKEFISPEYFLDFFSNLYIPPCVQKSFKFIVLSLLENTFVSQKPESVYSWSQAKLSPGFYHHHSRQKKITHCPQTKCFENLFFLSRQERGLYRAENMTKIKLARILVTTFDKFNYFQPLHFWFLFCCAII